MISTLPIFTLEVSVLVYSKTLNLHFQPIAFSIPLHDQINFSEINQVFLSKMEEISKSDKSIKKSTFDKSKFFLHVAGRKLSEIKDGEIEMNEILDGIQTSRSCTLFEDTTSPI